MTTKLVTISLLLALGGSTFATQDRNYGLGGSSTGRAGGVTADSETPFAALLNPALLAAKKKTDFAFSTYQANASFGSLGKVIVDSPLYRTREGRPLTQEYKPENFTEWLWALGLAYPFNLPKKLQRRAGVGVVVSGPFTKLRTLNATTPYEFSLLRYGNSDAQFKATASISAEIFPEWLTAGIGTSFFISGAGASDAAISTTNPTGRLNLDVGLNSSLVAGLYAKWDTEKLKHRFAVVYRQAIDPEFTQSFDGQIQVREGVNTLSVPVTLKTTLYYEPHSIEGEWQGEFSSLKLSVGVSYQLWSKYRPAFLEVKALDAERQTRATDIPTMDMSDTINPRVSVEIPVGRFWTVSSGYQYRPSPVKSLSGPSNLLDSNAHVVGLSVRYDWAGNEWWPMPTSLSAFGQFHHLSLRPVNKASETYVGAPHYDFSGNAYTYGLSLTLVL